MAKADKTRRKLAEALIELVTRSSIEEVKIGDICKIADVERKTFYNHFKDKYDLAAWIYDQEFSDIYFDCEEDVTKESLIKQTLALVNIIVNGPRNKFYKKLFSDSSQNALFSYMRRTSYEFNSAVVKEYYGISELSDEQKLAILYYSSALHGITYNIVMGDLDVPIEKYVKYQYEMIPDFLLEATSAYLVKHSGSTRRKAISCDQEI